MFNQHKRISLSKLYQLPLYKVSCIQSLEITILLQSYHIVTWCHALKLNQLEIAHLLKDVFVKTVNLLSKSVCMCDVYQQELP